MRSFQIVKHMIFETLGAAQTRARRDARGAGEKPPAPLALSFVATNCVKGLSRHILAR